MKVALYARVSTSDREQDPETQLMPMRDFCVAQGWEIVAEYVDHAPANDLAHRVRSLAGAWSTYSATICQKYLEEEDTHGDATR